MSMDFATASNTTLATTNDDGNGPLGSTTYPVDDSAIVLARHYQNRSVTHWKVKNLEVVSGLPTLGCHHSGS